MGTAAGLHGDPIPSSFALEDVYARISFMPLAQVRSIAEKARDWISYARSLDDEQAALLATVLESAAAVRVAMLTR